MTDQTVPVPLDLLKELKASYHSSSRVFSDPDNMLKETVLVGDAYDRVIDLIPTPPKVGDVLTAAQVATLPLKAVVIDVDEDAWIVIADGKTYTVFEGRSEASTPEKVYEPYTLVYLPASD